MTKNGKRRTILSIILIFILGLLSLLINPIRTLSSFQKHKDHQLYTMTYFGNYDYLTFTIPHSDKEFQEFSEFTPLDIKYAFLEDQACTIFAATGGELNIYGRNRDMGDQNNALLLVSDPPDGYASISLVDLNQFGVNPGSFSLSFRILLLAAPLLPTEGMNEHGLTIAKADVPINNMDFDPNKKALFFRTVMRVVLDHARTTKEAVELLDDYNIYFGSTGGHFLIADPSGDSAIVEFYDNEMHVIRSTNPWQVITNFCIGKAIEDGDLPKCSRYQVVEDSLLNTDGIITTEGAMSLLEQASVPQTIWSVVFDMTSRDIDVVMYRNFKDVYHISADEW